ncbi:MAG: TrmH family RNA methyltransferase [Venatoribacter sp.]
MNIDDVKKLTQKKYREEQQHYLLEGEHLLLELFKAAQSQPYLKHSQLFITEQHQDWVNQYNHHHLRTTVIGHKAMSQISDTKSPQGLLAVVPFAQTKAAASDERAVYLHEIQDPGNLGTILRSLAWFGGFRLLLSPNSVDVYNPKVIRSSMGAIFHVPFEQGLSFEQLQQRYPRLAYLDMQGCSIRDASFKQFDAYLFGNEARGVPQQHLKQSQATAFTIQGSGQIESLNLATAVSLSAFTLAG